MRPRRATRRGGEDGVSAAAAAAATSPNGNQFGSRHKPRHAAGAYATRMLPEELLASEEAVEVWEAAKSASHTKPLIAVRGWKIEWRPRPGGGGKKGDLYIWQPGSNGAGAADSQHGLALLSGRPIRSLSALQDVLALRHAAQQAGGQVWAPPLRGSLVEVHVDVTAAGRAVDAAANAPSAVPAAVGATEEAADPAAAAADAASAAAAAADGASASESAQGAEDGEEAAVASDDGGEPSAPAADAAAVAPEAEGATSPGGCGGEGSPGAWRRAEVRRVELGLGGSFQVCVYDASGEPDEAALLWCTAFNENATWRRLAGEPVFAPRRPGAAGRSLGAGKATGGKRVRRCGECAGCIHDECGECSACLDKPRFGGPGRMKQACKRRTCMQPILPAEAFGEGDENGAQRANALYGGAGGGARMDVAGDDDDDSDSVSVDVVDAEADEAEEGGVGGAGGGGVALSPDEVELQQAEAEAARLRRQLGKLHALASSYREKAEEVSTAARYLFPLAHAAVGLAGGSLEAPDCFHAPLPPLPPKPAKPGGGRPRQR